MQACKLPQEIEAMKENLSTVTKKGQVTIPVDIRRFLGVGPHDKVAFVLEDDHVCVVRPGSVVERTAGAFKGLKPSKTADELRAAAEGAIAQEATERTGG